MAKRLTLTTTIEVDELPPWGPTPVDTFWSTLTLLSATVAAGDREFQFDIRVEGLTDEEQAAMTAAMGETK